MFAETTSIIAFYGASKNMESGLPCKPVNNVMSSGSNVATINV